jgi:preprotein translocase subunit SecG
VVVLLQKSEGGALGIGGGSGGTGGFFTGRGQTNLLTRTTAILGTLFFITSLGLSILSRYGTGSGSLIDSMAPRAPASSTAPAAPGSGSGGVLDELKKMQNNNNPPSVPAAPSLPVPGAPTPQK